MGTSKCLLLRLPIICCFFCMCLCFERTGIAQDVEFLFSIGSHGSGDGQFDVPNHVTLDDVGNVYVTDFFNNRVSVFDNAGTYLSSFGSAGGGPGQFEFAGGIVLDDSGNIYVADRRVNNVQVFDNNGSFLFRFGTSGNGNGQFEDPYGIALDNVGNIYVTDRDRVQVFDASGNFQFTFGSTGTGNGQFDFPVGIVVDDNGDIYVVDRLNHRVQTFDNAGNFLRTFGSQGTGNGEFEMPFGIALDEAGNIYVSENGADRVQVFNNAGDFQFMFGSSGIGIGQFSGDAAGIFVQGGRIYVVDTQGTDERVLVFGLISDSMTVVANSFVVTRGDHVSGGLPELAESDNMDLTIRRRNADFQSRTEFEVKGTSPTASPTSFEFTLEGAVFARGNVVQTIELFDYDLGDWELVDTSDSNRAPMPDKVVTVTPAGDLSRFVEAGTMSIEARIHFQSDSPRQRFASNTDQAVWTIGQ